MIKKEKKKMNKTELISAMSVKMGSTKKAAGEALDAFVESVVETVGAGEEVSIVGFGKFSVAERAEREGRNPQTGESITIAASKAPKFKASSNFKNVVNS